MLKDSNFQIFFSELKLSFRKPAAFLPSGCSFFENLSSFHKNPNMLRRVGFALDWLCAQPRRLLFSALIVLKASLKSLNEMKERLLSAEGRLCAVRCLLPPFAMLRQVVTVPAVSPRWNQPSFPLGVDSRRTAPLVAFTRGRSELNQRRQQPPGRRSRLATEPCDYISWKRREPFSPQGPVFPDSP